MNTDFESIKTYLQKQAVVLDVRTLLEFNQGHIENALHIPLDELVEEIEALKKLNKPIITCCRSGARSERAKDFLIENDIDAINGGPWQNVMAISSEM